MYDPASVPLLRLEAARLRRHFAVQWLRGIQAISEPDAFELEITNDGDAIDPAALMYQTVFISFKGGDQGFHGQVHAITRSNYRPGPVCYRLRVGPRLACLNLRNNSRIFQGLNTLQIIRRVLQENGIGASACRFELSGDWPERELRTQYNENDLQLIQRLLSEDGLHYHFCHSRRGHELVIGAGLRGFGRSPVAPWRQLPQQPGVTDFKVDGSGQNGQDSRTNERAFGTSTLPFVSAGQLLPLVDHPVAEWNHMWLVTRVEHHYDALGNPKDAPYRNRFQAIPWEVSFRAPLPVLERKTPDLRRAWVLGPEGQTVERDRHNRVSVQFDPGGQGRGARYNECWLPLAPGLDLPLLGGMAVAVGYAGGDIDRPMIVAGLAAPGKGGQAHWPTGEPDNLCMQLDRQVLVDDTGRVRMEGAPALDLHERSELFIKVGASQLRLDSHGLTLISPRLTFVSAATYRDDDRAMRSTDKPAVGTAQTPGDAAQGDTAHQSEQQERQP